MRDNKVLLMAEVAIMAALAVLLSFVQFSGAWVAGGSVSLEMLPIFLFAFRRGLKWGAILGLIYGLLDLMIRPYIVHPIQLLLDYPIPFMLVGFAGMIKIDKSLSIGKKIGFVILGTTIGSVFRFISHFISGMVFFGSGAAPGQSVAAYSFFYNISYMAPSYVFDTIILILLILVNQSLVERR